MLGVKFLKKGIKEETAVYTEFTKSAGWVAPDITNMIAQLNTDLGELQGSQRSLVLALHADLPTLPAGVLRNMRQRQEADLRALLNAGPLGLPQDGADFSEVKMEESFIQKMLDVQVDLSDM